MTTSVTINAHAGWPVKVVLVDRDIDGVPVRYTINEVEPYSEQVFNVWDWRTIEIYEMNAWKSKELTLEKIPVKDEVKSLEVFSIN